jgi:hypothetical protein
MSVIAGGVSIPNLQTKGRLNPPGAQIRSVTKIEVPSKGEHPYRFSRLSAVDGDVALLKLKKSFTGVRPVRLGSAAHLIEGGVTMIGRILGHGGTAWRQHEASCPAQSEPEEQYFSPALRQGYLAPANTSAAGTTTWGPLPDDVSDGAPPTVMASGDSGGPVLIDRFPSHEWVQVGVISAGAQVNDPNEYTDNTSARVDYFWQFIDRVVGGDTLAPLPSDLAGLKIRLKMGKPNRRTIQSADADPCRPRDGSSMLEDVNPRVFRVATSTGGWRGQNPMKVQRGRYPAPASAVVVNARDGSDIESGFAEFKVQAPGTRDPHMISVASVTTGKNANPRCPRRSNVPVGGSVVMPAQWTWDADKSWRDIGGDATMTLKRTGRDRWSVEVELNAS